MKEMIAVQPFDEKLEIRSLNSAVPRLVNDTGDRRRWIISTVEKQ
jgi:hypothetical protein